MGVGCSAMAVKPLLADTVKPLAISLSLPGSPKETRYYQTILLKHTDLAPLFLFFALHLELRGIFFIPSTIRISTIVL
jgi:hypothetical protein